MHNSMVSGLITAAVLSLSLSLCAMAEETMQMQTQTKTTTTNQYGGTTQTQTRTTTTNQYNTYSTQNASETLIPQTGMSNLVMNNQFGYTQDEIIIGSSDASSPMFLPKLTIGSANTSILVLNPTPKPVSLSIPQLNSTSVIPPNGARVIQLDKAQTASLTPGQEVAYYINDSDGNQIASSNFINTQEIVSMIDINTQVASTEETRTPIRKPTERKSTVRGYW